MGLKKFAKRVVKKAKGLVAKTPVGSVFGMDKEKAPAADDAGQRSAAAKRLIDQTKQAGAGQIKYQTEETI